MTESPSALPGHSSELEAALRDAARDGSPAAQARVVRAAHGLLALYLAPRAPAPTDTDDLSQQVLIEALGSLSRWRRTGDPVGWLLGIARNVLRRAWRAHAREAARRSRLAAEMSARLAERLDDAADRAAERLAALAACEGNLPDGWRDLVDLHYRQHHSLDAIAHSRAIAKGTVGATLFRARARLRACIEAHLAETSR